LAVPAIPRKGKIMGFRYTGIRVRDLNRSIEFYTKVLGMLVTWRMKIRETGGEIAVLKSPRGSQRLELNWYPPRGRYRRYRQGDELDHLAFSVPDVDAFLRDRRGDFKVAMRPFDEGGERLAYVTDPDGAWIELMSPRKSRRKPAKRASG
jgi:lactoylglutathione lyase